MLDRYVKIVFYNVVQPIMEQIRPIPVVLSIVEPIRRTTFKSLLVKLEVVVAVRKIHHN